MTLSAPTNPRFAFFSALLVACDGQHDGSINVSFDPDRAVSGCSFWSHLTRVGTKGAGRDSLLRAGLRTRSADARELVARQQDQRTSDPESHLGGDPWRALLHGADQGGVRSLFP